MLHNFFKIALRNLWKHKITSVINIAGLALGMACCFLIILYADHELNYDQFHPNKDRLYQIKYHLNLATEIEHSRIPPPIGPLLTNYIPGIEAVSRFYPRDLSIQIPENHQQFELEDVYFVDSTASMVFHFDPLHGNVHDALRQPRTVIVSAKTAEKLFGSTDVTGRTLQLAGVDGYRVGAVVKDWPDNSHLEFTMLLPYVSMVEMEPENAREITRWVLESNWIATHSYTYVLLEPGQDPEKVNAAFSGFIREKGDERFREKQSFSLVPVTRIHQLPIEGEPRQAVNLNYLYLLLSIGIITLLIACINFINLTTAGSLNRAKEAGVRKVLGAQRTQLIYQFLGESTLLSLLAFALALLFAYQALPTLNHLTGLEIQFLNHNPRLFFLFLAIFLATGFLAGLYPAFFITRFRPVSMLKDRIQMNQNSGSLLRKGLISLQFLAATGFIAGSLVCFMQLDFLRSRSLGFDKDLIINLPLNSSNNINSAFRPGDPAVRQRMNSYDEQLLTHPNIRAVTQSYQAPGLGAVQRNVWNDLVPASAQFFPGVLAVDYDYVETFDLELIAGRDFDLSFGTDHLQSFLINEQAVKTLGWEDARTALGQEMVLEGKAGQVVGVLKDFNYSSLRDEIQPLVLEIRPGAFSIFSVKIGNSDIPATLRFMEEKWKDFFPEKVFTYHFLNESLDDTYRAESRLATIIGYFAFMAILISCFGLFGLSALMTRARFKEIGVRKILGASVVQILRMLSTEYIRLAFLAMVVAIPLVWYFLQDWLSGFAYRIAFPWWVIPVTGLAVMLLTFLTVSIQSLRTALSNPVEAVRNE